MFREGDSNVDTWTTFIGAAAELAVLVVAAVLLAVLLAVLAVVALLELGCEVTVTIFSVTVFVPLDPQPARASAITTNAPITLVTIGSLYTEQLTGRFQS
jgi:hypothetical protein